MSGGWSPSFATKFTGSLRGKPNHLLVWDYMTTCKDRNGIVDESSECIAQALGLPVDVVERVIDEFCLPDPRSRSQFKEGRRLERVPQRGFGWRVVNHDVYRERARKREYDQQRTESGADAQRKRDQRPPRPASDVPTRPAMSRESRVVPLSYSDADAYQSQMQKTESEGDARGNTPRDARRAPRGWKRLPADFQPDDELRAWAAEKAPDVDFERELEAIRDYEFTKVHTDAAATVRTWLRTEQKRRGPKRLVRIEGMESKFQRAKRKLHEAAGD